MPLSMDGTGTGGSLVPIVAPGSFVTTLLLGGRLQTLPVLIYQQFNTTRDFGMVGTPGTVLLAPWSAFCRRRTAMPSLPARA